MLCDRCKKNAATVHVEKVINGEKSVLNLCQACAASGSDILFDWSSFMDGLLGAVVSGSAPQAEVETYCEHCGTSFSQFQKTGRFGCHKCYAAFEPRTAAIIKNIHGGNRHTGKVPKRLEAEVDYQKALEDLKFNLRRAVESEEYEEAARLRDQIRALSLGSAEKEGQL